jgi:hypothetical protein
MDLEGLAPCGKKEVLSVGFVTGNMVIQFVDAEDLFSLFLHLEAPRLEFVGASTVAAGRWIS